MAKLARMTRASNDSLWAPHGLCSMRHRARDFNSVRVFASNDASMILNRVKRQM